MSAHDDALSWLRSALSGLVSGKGDARLWVPEQHIDALREASVEGWRPIDQRGEGDCWIACLASLTGIPPEDFPQPPSREHWGDDQHEQAYSGAVRGFLRKRGWFLHRMWQVPKGYAIATGDSPRLDGFSHCVVVRDGRVVHDPHPSREGLGTKNAAEFEVLIPLVTSAPPSTPAVPPSGVVTASQQTGS